MRIAFHAPLKPPDHPVPSGDRQIARLLIAALGHAGHQVTLASRLRTREPTGDPASQQALIRQAQEEVARLTREFRSGKPDIWFTYHNYYKAPDLIGPEICKAFGIPYVLAEASDAGKRLDGPWADFALRARQAIRAADAILNLNQADQHAIAALVGPDRLHGLSPFMRTRPRPLARARQAGPVRLLAVGMMRHGDKLASFRELAEALRGLRGLDWHLTLVGDGPAARQVRTAFAPLRDRVNWLGQVPATHLSGIMRRHDLMVWPAVNEAFGMALVEAACCGLPVVAGHTGGVPDVVAHGRTGLLVPPHDRLALQRAMRHLLRQPRTRHRLAGQAWRDATGKHGFAAASRKLHTILTGLLEREEPR